MPIFFQQQINDFTRLGIWKIEETEDFFKGTVPQHRDVTHPHKRLQHLAGRFLLQYLFPDFPYELVLIADTKKPYLPDEQFHFSISHCGDYAAAIVSSQNRVGIDIEIPVKKILNLEKKYLSEKETAIFGFQQGPEHMQTATLLWSCKESVFKWYGDGAVDFRKHIQLNNPDYDKQIIHCRFSKSQQQLSLHFRLFDHLVLSWVVS